MKTDAIRHFFDYRSAENRNLWDQYIMPITQNQYTQSGGYSQRSMCNYVAHVMNVDNSLFREIRGDEIPNKLPVHFHKREKLRGHRENFEIKKLTFLSEITDDALLDSPLDGEDKDLSMVQVLLQNGESRKGSLFPNCENFADY
jgi:uncharacterized damage-inducible protein DinB